MTFHLFYEKKKKRYILAGISSFVYNETQGTVTVGFAHQVRLHMNKNICWHIKNNITGSTYDKVI